MSSCCGMPPPSSEPTYPVPAGLLDIFAKWDQRYPGFYQAATTDIGCGDWDGMQEGLDIPPYTLGRAIEASIQHLREAILRVEHAEKRRVGAWHVKWGITRLEPTLSEQGKAAVETYQREARNITESSKWVGAEFNYNIEFKTR